jgi:hypothetical protein
VSVERSPTAAILNLVPFRGNLSTRSLVGVVKKEDVVQDSEYLETLIVAVPK